MNAGGPVRGLIDGRFELLERLGGGGMGLVWRARDTMLQREVALKEVRSAEQAVYDDDPVAAHVMRERVLREARALARLHHPNVVTIYHIVDSVEHRHPWLVMELVSGGSLDDRIKRGPLPPQEVAHIGRGVLAALRAAHAAGIQHRDVKPANVLLHTDGTPVLTDFGIAALRESSNLTATGALIGSPEYIAPERIRGHEGDPASDLWSLGMLMYVALEGHNPLRRDTTLATLAAVLDAQIPEPTHAGPLTPVLRAVLARDAAARPDAAQLDHMLGAAEQGAISAMYGNNPAASASYVSPVPPFGPSGAAYGSSDALYAGTDFADAAQLHDPLQPPAPGPFNSGQHQYPQHGSRQPRRRRRATFIATITGTAVIGLAVALVWTLRDSPASASTGNNAGAGSTGTSSATVGGLGTGTNPSASASASAGTSDPASPLPTSTGSGDTRMITPAEARSTVNALQQHFSGRKIIELILNPGYASVEVETAADPTLYDEYWYRGGTYQHVLGGSVTDELPIDFSAISWNALPTLYADADRELKLPHPTSRWVAIEGNWLDQGSPGLAIYLSDDYGSAYLIANLKGHVLQTFPRS